MGNVQFVTDDHGRRMAVMIPVEEWEKIQKAKDILEHVYLSGLIEDRKSSKAGCSLDDLITEEDITRADLEG
jgi:hypothetical protein